MDMPTHDAAASAMQNLPIPSAASLEAVELELALAQREMDGESFEQVVREAVEAVGGVLLFKLRLGDAEAGRWVAAAALGEAAEREIVIVELAGEGAPVAVSLASESALPIAAIAPAYAGLAACWPKAA